MKIFVGLVSTNDIICQIYNRQRAKLIPNDIRLRRDYKPEFHMNCFNPSKDRRLLEDFLLKNVKNVDAAILLIESGHESLAEKIRNAFFTAIISFDEFREKNPLNYWHSKLARLLKNFATLVDTMLKADNEQIMILPIRNFNSEHLRDIVQICRTKSMSSELNNDIGLSISKLKDKKRPRRNSKNKTMYIVDDEEKCFIYGKEKHARLPTGNPHIASCELNGRFRFGKSISHDRHFNVTKETTGNLMRISGDFKNCHDETIHIKETTHLNMFSNDFF